MKAKYCPCLSVKLFADIATRSIHLRLSRRRGKMNIRYRVELSEAERSELGSLLRGGQHAARKLKRAQILLAADAGVPDETIAQSLGVGFSIAITAWSAKVATRSMCFSVKGSGMTFATKIT